MLGKVFQVWSRTLCEYVFSSNFRVSVGGSARGRVRGGESTIMAAQPLAPRWSALMQLLELKLLGSLAELSVKWHRVAASSTHLVFLRIWHCAVSKAPQMDKSGTKLVSPKRGWQEPAIRRCSASTLWISGALKVVNRVITLQWTPKISLDWFHFPSPSW